MSTTPKPQMQEQPKPQIPPRPAIPADTAAYSKLSEIYIELKKHNAIIFEAEKERNTLEDQRDNLKGLAKLTKKVNCKQGLIKRTSRLKP